jgi:hypothetical protein
VGTAYHTYAIYIVGVKIIYERGYSQQNKILVLAIILVQHKLLDLAVLNLPVEYPELVFVRLEVLQQLIQKLQNMLEEKFVNVGYFLRHLYSCYKFVYVAYND